MPVGSNAARRRWGDEIATDERRYTEPLEESAVPRTLYMGLEGTGIPMRTAELAGRAGKQPDGSAKTREVKLCAVWSAEARDPEGLPLRDAGSVTYSAAIESAATPESAGRRSAFAERVSREAARRRFSDAPRRAILRRRAVDLEYRAGIVSRRDPDRRPVSCRGNSAPHRSIELWSRRRAKQAMGDRPLHGVGRRRTWSHRAGPATVRRVLHRRGEMRSVPLPQPPTNALSEVSRTRVLHIDGRRRSRM